MVPALIGSALFQQERVRNGGNFGVQFRPTDELEVNLTGLYSKFNANNFNQNFLAWGSNAIGGGGTLTNFNVEDDTVASGTITSTPGGRAAVFDAIDRLAFSEVWSGDFDAIWRPSDLATVHFKTGYTKARGNTKAQPFFEGGAPAKLHLRPHRPDVRGHLCKPRPDRSHRHGLRLRVAAQDHQQRQGKVRLRRL